MKKVLLVEDDPFIIDIYTNQLKREGYMVDVAVNGEMALNKIRNNYPDLTILDIKLPKLNGYEVLKAVRQDSKTKNQKIIVISNINREDLPADIFSLGILKYFLKVESTSQDIANAVKEILK